MAPTSASSGQDCQPGALLEPAPSGRCARSGTPRSAPYQGAVASTPGSGVAISEKLEHMTFNMNLRMISGNRYEDEEFEEVGSDAWRFKTAMNKALGLSGRSVLSDAIPWLGWLDFQGQVRSMKETGPGARLRAREVAETTPGEEIKQRVSNPGILTGTESTSITITWALSSSSQPPGRSSNLPNRSSMPSSGKTNGSKIAKETRVWAKPDEFRPERFLKEQEEVDLKIRTSCLFRSDSGSEVLPRIHAGVAGFQVTPEEGATVDMEEGSGIALPKVKPLRSCTGSRAFRFIYENL
ncbi:xanthotoxin 5-hydroxylase CYP82C2-like [Eucalyptus grandis]|uniref:xanthotoxin 5-hydroxylase CYP82C2-like n=1 Tax=Eucalyptus grandis TaxID=71139 RepID=UPI00192EF1E2|nr:xanthotoxin 5-hydroxylase CYP82C2-like [Eucalyptus grandis]